MTTTPDNLFLLIPDGFSSARVFHRLKIIKNFTVLLTLYTFFEKNEMRGRKKSASFRSSLSSSSSSVGQNTIQNYFSSSSSSSSQSNSQCSSSSIQSLGLTSLEITQQHSEIHSSQLSSVSSLGLSQLELFSDDCDDCDVFNVCKFSIFRKKLFDYTIDYFSDFDYLLQIRKCPLKTNIPNIPKFPKISIFPMSMSVPPVLFIHQK